MTGPRIAPYGSWKSPITSDLIAGGTIGLGQVALDRRDVYWTESRPAEAGRTVLVRHTPDGSTADLTPPPFNVRTRVHEYGGGSFVIANGTVYFSNFADQRLYRQDPGANPRSITPEVDLRYADSVLDQPRRRLICVREDHTAAGREAVNTLVSVNLDQDDQGGQVLVSGNDFYAAPRLSPDGARLAWLTWNHPNMPWDGTELWVAEVLGDGSIGRLESVAGAPAESICQPEWSPDGVLHFISDRTAWWNLYRWEGGRALPLHAMQAEFGQPQWAFGQSTYDFVSADEMVCAYAQQGTWRLAHLQLSSLRLEPIEIPYTVISGLRASAGRVAFSAASPSESTAIVQLDLATGRHEVLRRSSEAVLDRAYISDPEAIEFPTEHGLTAHALFYRPRNRDFAAPPNERPPLIVKSHGGPTGSTSAALEPNTQYWTSRGFAVVDVNYGGSTGYGRVYRRRLDGQWGIVDVDDCVNAARFLAERGDVHANRLAIRGGSAGGFTTLAALTFRDVFKAGASYYGISDLEALATDTHKFESRYLDRLVGPYPERRDLYRDRSPIHFTDRLSSPLILFQGLDDRVVPPNQAEMMFEAVRQKGLPVALLTFEGEQHGFRRADTIKRALDAELYFYSKVFGFELADPVEPVRIENL